MEPTPPLLTESQATWETSGEGGIRRKKVAGNWKDLRRGHEVQDTILRVRVKWDHTRNSDTGERFVLPRKKGHFLERLNFDLWRRDSDIRPVVSNYSLLLAAPAGSANSSADILKEALWLWGPVFEEINDKAGQCSAKVFFVFFFWQGLEKIPL